MNFEYILPESLVFEHAEKQDEAMEPPQEMS